MKQVEEIIYELEELRRELNSLISEKTKLIESQVIETSQKLDAVLNTYSRLTQS
ncbi:Spo0E family sporulation regulatory protein-aspartic acid phosphatase [Anaeromicrobium sediminis]|uniref:Aspartyl-phosphate phosphatase Spo0E family protein n=1 Tax=Anaeromicrobium sediminis TaxID=1478221 RepID=A0A267MLI8_9FIRM|nr:Spo0E family sporulation regulatory protein-aspartic acid phosphatase [Anaeromicrobium sediminis]PAB60474.1 hypothetical protein CCE28_06140 [Anaeromicrobium sediminis]